MNSSANKIRQFSSILFLIVFITFLGLSISHSHHFGITTKDNASISEENNNNNADPFLDSSLNCTIHTFVNSLKFDIVFSFNEIIPELNKAHDNYYELSNYSYPLSNLNQLRAPPRKLV
jgi:uncharacterized membrane protein